MKDYRPIPFWSWNDKLDTDKISWQIKEMAEQGIGGFVIHARAGLQTGYMQQEWFESIDCAVNQAKALDLSVWIYDENGWPSGFGNGVINGLGIAYQQKYLRIETGEAHTERTICNEEGYHLYFDINPFYIDTLDKEVVSAFVDTIYEPYYHRYRNDIQGFFTDEPQVSRNGIPWSFVLEDAFRNEYGKELLPLLPELFYDTGAYQQTRVQFWRLVTKLFSCSYAKQIGNWCRTRGLQLTGHLLLEETLLSQLTTNGACMPGYKYFDMPGVDWLGGLKKDLLSNARIPLTFKQVESVAHQFGKKRVLTETFAASGHDISFSEMRGLLEWQMVRGINVVCPHLQAYSTLGSRKRDHPPVLSWQQPWWKHYRKQNDYLAAVGELLGEGQVVYNTLLIHNQSSAWAVYSPFHSEATIPCQESLEIAIEKLELSHQLFHLGDELLMEEHARVVGNEIIIGSQHYNTVVLPDHSVFQDETERILHQFRGNGGKIISVDDIENNPVIDNKHVLYTCRRYEDSIIHYFVNASQESQLAAKVRGSEYLDPPSGLWKPFDGYYQFSVNDSLITRELINEKEQFDLFQWELEEIFDNAYLMDYCDYYFDGNLQEKNGYVLNVLERACRLKRPVEIDLHFYAEIMSIPDQLYLAGEAFDQYQIFVNRQEVVCRGQESFIDDCITKTDISKYVCAGQNEIHLKFKLDIPASFYQELEQAHQFESEANKLAFPVVMEPVYLVGNFGVYAKQQIKEHGENYINTGMGFYLDRQPTVISLKNIEQQGFLFFSGTMKLKNKLKKRPGMLRFRMHGINSIEVYLNHKQQGIVLWEDETVELKASEAQENVEICLVLQNNLRNLWGPHHYQETGRIVAWPRYFYKEDCLWGYLDDADWSDDYIFREMGVEIEEYR